MIFDAVVISCARVEVGDCDSSNVDVVAIGKRRAILDAHPVLPVNQSHLQRAQRPVFLDPGLGLREPPLPAPLHECADMGWKMRAAPGMYHHEPNERAVQVVDALGGHDGELHPLGWRKVTAAPALEEDLPGLGPTDHKDVATHRDVHGVDPGDIGLGVEDRGKGFVGGIEGGGERARVVSTARARGGGRLLWQGVLLGKTIGPAGGVLSLVCRGGG